MKQRKNVRAEILDGASKAVNGTRDVAYGQPEDNFGRIANLINAHLKNRFGDEANVVTAGDVAILGIQFKLGRLGGNMSHMDSWMDVAGYAACGAEVESKS